MSESIAHTIISPTLIGRDAQHAALVELFARVHFGGGQTLLVGGEAGIGKSRLIAELIPIAQRKKAAILTGRCFEMDSTIPCALLADLLRDNLTAQRATEIVQDLGPSALELARVLPELHALLATSALPIISVPEPDQRRLFDAIVRFLVTPSKPTLIVVEDAHWCDTTSLEFLHFLARKVTAHPILLVITYRDNETSAALARLLAALDRERLAIEIHLTRLTKSQTDEMLRAIFTMARPTQEDFLDALYTLTEGNPFFIEEVLKSCVASGDIFQVGGQWGRRLLSQLHIPRTVQVAVGQRVEQLTPAAQHILKVAAVIGQRFDFSLLQELGAHDETSLIAFLRELIEAQLIIEESADRFVFRHALTRQAVYFGLLGRERRVLHRSVAQVLERQPGHDARLSELATHFHTAGEWEKTWEYARRAGERAQTLYAPRAAVEHFTHALEAAEHLTRQALDEAHAHDLAELYRARGEAYETLGEFDAARTDFEQALAIARAHLDHRIEWHSLLDLGFLWTSRDFGVAGEHFQQAISVARILNEPAILAQSLNRVGNWHVNTEQPHIGARYHAEALAIFQTLNDPAGIAATVDLLAGATLLASDPHVSMAHYEHATSLFRTRGEQRGLTSCLSWLTQRGPIAINLLTPLASLSKAAALADEALTLAREINWRPGEAFAMFSLGFALGTQGKYGEALTLLENAVTLAQEIDHRWDTVVYIAQGALYLDLAMPAAAQEVLERGRDVAMGHNMQFSQRMTAALLAAAYTAQNQNAKSSEVLDTAFDDRSVPFPKAGEPAPTMAQRLYWLVRAENALHEQRAADALAIVNDLLATTGEIEPTPATSVSRLLKLRGEALVALHAVAEAEKDLLRALQAASVQGVPAVEWRIHLQLGHLYKAQGERNRAEGHFASARNLIETIAATLHTPTLRQQFLQSALAQIPAPATLTPLRAHKQSYDGLTARECDVARLIQQGKSDREIGTILSLSTRTVSSHVGNILAKLDFSSRAQIAAWAVAKGL